MSPEDLLASAWAHTWAFLLGTLFGSHANVWIARIPVGMSILRHPSKSFCMSCRTPIRWFDQFPVASYFVLRGRCRACGARFSVRYLLVELSAGLLAMALWQMCMVVLHLEEPPGRRVTRFAIYLLFVVFLEVIAVIDLETRRAPRTIALPAVPLFYALGFALGDVVWWDRLLGVVGGYGAARLLAAATRRLARREVLRDEDGPLLALIGALLGWRAVGASLAGGAVLAGVLTISMLATRRPRTLPVGPLLVVASLAFLFLPLTPI